MAFAGVIEACVSLVCAFICLGYAVILGLRLKNSI